MTSASTYFRGFLEGLHDPLVLLVGGLQLELQLLDLDAGGPFLHSDKEQFEGEFTFFFYHGSWRNVAMKGGLNPNIIQMSNEGKRAR